MLRLLIVLLLCSLSGRAQKALSREISIRAVKQPLKEVLTDMEKQGRFYFSYSSGLIAEDSLVSLQVSRQKVSDVLRILFREEFQYKTVHEYIIIRKAPPEKYIFLEGVLLDRENEEWIDHASVYSKAHLVSAISDDNGYFKLRIKERLLPLSLTVSKLGYQDTTIIYPGPGESRKIYLSRKVFALDEAVITRSGKKGRFKPGFLVSATQRIHSRNLGSFFMALPYQMSVTPGVSTQGKLSSQVVNKVSVNLIGGYTGGVNGVEMAGLFNINQKNAQYFQAAGLFNTVSGSVKGVQAGGLYNTVADSLNGFQAGGLFNTVWGAASGMQISGVYGLTGRSIRGIQVSGIFSRVKDTLSGVQIAGIVNTAGHLSGVQVGLINFAESSDGTSIGLLNFIKNGKLDIQAYTSELFPAALAVKSGTPRFYTSLVLAGDFLYAPVSYGFSVYLGTEVPISDRWKILLEAGQSTIAWGKWENSSSFLRFQPELHYRAFPRVSVFAGLALSAYRSSSDAARTENTLVYIENRVRTIALGDRWTLWGGWQAGLAFHLKK
ncbi:MAG: carboxypeptidase-like regulatory domain-containing protein [Leadbetterella sp.]|nr:carboxypeptidase-like regulatory domain-containing protein [Leadbetterella sp.]